MIDSVHFKNFKNLKNVDCTLAPFTVIVGPNACGKTSLLEGIHFLSRLVTHHSTDDIATLFRGTSSLESLHSSDGGEAMVLSCASDGDSFEFQASKSPTDADWRQRLGDSGWLAGLGDGSGQIPLDFPFDADRNKAASAIQSLTFLQLEASRLARPSYSELENPRVEFSGDGLASVIAHMKLSAEEDFESLKEMMKRIVPELQTIRVVKKKSRTYEKEIVSFRNERVQTTVPKTVLKDALVFDFTNRKDIPASNLSEGTLVALGLLAVLHSPSRPRVILLDDIERGLHPKAQKKLVEIVREVLKRQVDLQVIATSHSPYFLDFLNFEEVRLMTIGVEGYSICGRLEEHPKFEKWKDELAPGEMWSLFGEKWITEMESR